MMCSSAYVIKKGRSRYELTLIHLIISSFIQCHKKKYSPLNYLNLFLGTHILQNCIILMNASNLMKTPFTRIALSRCPWYMRTKRHSTNNIFSTILIHFLAQTCSDLTFRIHVGLICAISSWRKIGLSLICQRLLQLVYIGV